MLPGIEFQLDHEGRLVRVILVPDLDPALLVASARPDNDAERAVIAFLSGRSIALDPATFAPPPWTGFRRAVMDLLARVPRGRVISYGALAAALGRPGAARAVGTAMATNPFPLFYPCHRVVPADGRPGPYMGTAGRALKVRLLRLEGVEVDAAGRIPPGFRWVP